MLNLAAEHPLTHVTSVDVEASVCLVTVNQRVLQQRIMSFESLSTDVTQEWTQVVVNGVNMATEMFSLCGLVGALSALIAFHQVCVRH